MALFNRAIRVCFIDAGRIFEAPEYTIRAHIYKEFSSSGNSCELEIFNLSDDSNNIIFNTEQRVFISAGYVEDVPTRSIFQGNLKRNFIDKVGNNVVSRFSLLDGGTSKNRIRGSFYIPPNTTFRSGLRRIANEFGLSNVIFSGLGSDEIEISGFGLHGTLRDILNQYANQSRYNVRFPIEWSIQDNTLYVIPRGQVIPNETIIIDESSGLTKAPQPIIFTAVEPEPVYLRGVEVIKNETVENGVVLNLLLNPLIKPASRLQLNLPNPFQRFNGTYRAKEVKHFLSADSEYFYTYVQAIEYNA